MTTEKNCGLCLSENSNSDSECPCFHCTILGILIPDDLPTNETQDRLRKRLHQRHSKITTQVEPVNQMNVVKEKPRIEKVAQNINETVLIQPGPRDMHLDDIEDILEFIEGTSNKKGKIKDKDPVPTVGNKARRNTPDIETVRKSTKDLQLELEPKKEERRKVKAPKYEHADPQYKTNKFDVLDLDDDDDFYISEEESHDCAMGTNGDSRMQNLRKPTTKVNVLNKTAAKHSNPTPPPTIPKVEKAKHPIKELPSQIKKQKSPFEAEVQLSKKQKKKLAQQQSRQQSAFQMEVKTSVSKVESTAKSLSSAMHQLRLNDDTTIELVKENHGSFGCNTVNSNVSIMDQLNRGIKVEGLMLPPGITLTRVNPAAVEANRARMESIARISHPIPPVPTDPQASHLFISKSNQIMMPLGVAGQDPNGFVMIDPLNANNGSQLSKQQLLANAANAKLKRRRRQGRNKKSDEVNVLNKTAAKHSNPTPPSTVRKVEKAKHPIKELPSQIKKEADVKLSKKQKKKKLAQQQSRQQNAFQFRDSVFAPNQAVNLSELEPEERDIESFKRFTYFFEPPKNKPKVNFNVKDIKVRSKMKNSNSDSSSPYFGESSSMNGGETPTLDELYHDMSSLNLSNNCDPRQHVNLADGNYVGDHYLHGVVDELANGLID